MAQLFVGRKSLVIDIFGMSTEKEFVNTLEDVIQKGEQWTSSSPTVQELRSHGESKTYYEASSLMTGKVNPTINIKTLLNIVGDTSNETSSGI